MNTHTVINNQILYFLGREQMYVIAQQISDRCDTFCIEKIKQKLNQARLKGANPPENQFFLLHFPKEKLSKSMFAEL